jgi:molybdopterin-containing oxidoreductase family membrane subunit
VRTEGIIRPVSPLARLPVLPAAALVWLAALVVGALGVFQRLTEGHGPAAYGSYIPWGMWVAAYVYLIGLSAGAFLLSALVYVFDVRRLEQIGKLALFTALISLIGALLIIWFDIGHMERFWYVYTYGRPTSMMAWMVWLYTAYFVLILTELWFALRTDLARWSARSDLQGALARLLTFGFADVSAEAAAFDRRMLRLLGTIGVPLAIAFHGGVGALFAAVAARPFWNAAIYPIAFIVGALASGGALLTAVIAFFWPERGSAEHRELVAFLGRMTLGLLLFYLLLEWAEFSIGLYGQVPGESSPYQEILSGQYWWVFWVIHIVAGSIIPIMLLTQLARSVTWVGLAGSLIAGSFIAVRLNVVIPGLVTPQLEGLESAYVDSRLSFTYFPSVMEWLVVVFVGALMVGMFYAGYRLLPLVSERKGAES